jgi:hypothetical protein
VAYRIQRAHCIVLVLLVDYDVPFRDLPGYCCTLHAYGGNIDSYNIKSAETVTIRKMGVLLEYFVDWAATRMDAIVILCSTDGG